MRDVNQLKSLLGSIGGSQNVGNPTTSGLMTTSNKRDPEKLRELLKPIGSSTPYSESNTGSVFSRNLLNKPVPAPAQYAPDRVQGDLSLLGGQVDTQMSASTPSRVTENIEPYRALQAAKGAVPGLAKEIGSTAIGILDYIGRTGLQAVNALSVPIVTGVLDVAKSLGESSLKNTSYDDIWKNQIEAGAQRMIDIGRPDEYFRSRLTGTPYQDNKLFDENVRALARSSNLKMAQGDTSGSIADAGKIGWYGFLRDWANPFYLFNIKGFSEGSFKLTPKEKVIYTVQLNPAKQDFLLGGKSKTTPKSFVYEVQTKPQNIVSEAGKKIPEPKLKVYVEQGKTGTINVKVTNSGGAILPKDIVNVVGSEVISRTGLPAVQRAPITRPVSTPPVTTISPAVARPTAPTIQTAPVSTTITPTTPTMSVPPVVERGIPPIEQTTAPVITTPRVITPTTTEQPVIEKPRDIKKLQSAISNIKKQETPAEIKARLTKEKEAYKTSEAPVTVTELAPEKPFTKLNSEELKGLSEYEQGEYYRKLEIEQAKEKIAKQSKQKVSVEARIEKIKKAGGDIAKFNSLLDEVTAKGDDRAIRKVNEAIIEGFRKDFSETDFARMSKKGNITIDDVASYVAKTEAKTLNQSTERVKKLHQMVYDLVKKFGPKVTSTTKRGTLGTYTRHGDIVNIGSLNDLPTAVHEITHGLDTKYGITEKFVNEKNINALLELQNFYKKYYPKSKRNASLETQIREGFAMFMQRAMVDTGGVFTEGSAIASSLLNTESKGYISDLMELLTDSKEIVKYYSQLDELDKQVSKMGETELSDKGQDVFDAYTKIKQQIADYVFPFERISEWQGVQLTPEDASIDYRMIDRMIHLTMESKVPGGGFWLVNKEGQPTKVLDKNWGDLTSMFKGIKAYDKYVGYLYKRRFYFKIKELEQLTAKGELDEIEQKTVKQLAQELKNSKINPDEIKKSYLDNKDKYKEADKLFDSMNKATLQMAVDWGIMSPELGKTLLKVKGYAPMMHDFIDEVIGEPIITARGCLPSSLKKFGGKQGVVKDVIATSMVNQNDYLQKVMTQSFLTKLYKQVRYSRGAVQIMSEEKPKTQVVVPKIDGNIATVRIGDKVVKMKLNKTLANVIQAKKEMSTPNIVQNALRTSANLFSEGTTGWLYPAFMITNTFIDFPTGIAQTRNVMSPLARGVAEISKLAYDIISKTDSDTRKSFEVFKAMGGFRLGLSGLYDLSPEEQVKFLNNEMKSLELMLKYVNQGINYLKLPGTLSETFSRFGEYQGAIANGKNPTIAIEEAARVTGSFSHKGILWNNILRSIRDGRSYMNAGLQFPFNAIDTLRDPQTRGRALGTYFGIALITIGAALYAYERAKKEGDESVAQNAMQYLNLSLYDITNNMMVIGVSRKLNRIRTSSTYNVLASLLTMASIQLLYGGKFGVLDYLKVGGDAFLPSQANITKGPGVWTEYIPTIVAGEIGVSMNKKTFPEIQDLESISMRRKVDPAEMYVPGVTSDLAIKLAQTPFFRNLPTGERIGWSPIQIEYYLQSKLGRSFTSFTKYMEDGFFQGALKGVKETGGTFVKHGGYSFYGREFDQIDTIGDRLKAQEDRSKKSEDDSYSDVKINRQFVNTYSTDLSELKKITRAKQTVPIAIERTMAEIAHLITTGDYEKAKQLYYDSKGDIVGVINDFKTNLK